MYPNNWRKIWVINNLARHWANSGVISHDVLEKITSAYDKPFKSLHFALAIMVAIFTVVLILSAFFLLLYVSDALEEVGFVAFMTTLLSLLIFKSSHIIITEFHHMHTGVDDGVSLTLVVSSAFALVVSSWWLFDSQPSTLELYIYLTAGAAVSFYKYRTLVTSLIAISSVTALLAYLIFGKLMFNPGYGMIIFFIYIMLFLLFLQSFSKHFREGWQQQIESLEYYLLLILYLACNYFIIFKVASLYQNGYKFIDLTSLPLPFYLMTALLPLAMVTVGFIRANIRMIRVGTIGVLLSTITFKYNFFADNLDIFLLLGGSILLCFVLFAQRLLNKGIGRYINNQLLNNKHEELNLEGQLLNLADNTIKQTKS